MSMHLHECAEAGHYVLVATSGLDQSDVSTNDEEDGVATLK